MPDVPCSHDHRHGPASVRLRVDGAVVDLCRSCATEEYQRREAEREEGEQ